MRPRPRRSWLLAISVAAALGAGLSQDARADGVEAVGPWGGTFRWYMDWSTNPGCADYMWHRYFGSGAMPRGGYGFNELTPTGPRTASPLEYETQLERIAGAFAAHGHVFEELGHGPSLEALNRVAARLPNGTKVPIYGVNTKEEAFWMAGVVQNGKLIVNGTRDATIRAGHGTASFTAYSAVPRTPAGGLPLRHLAFAGGIVAAGGIEAIQAGLEGRSDGEVAFRSGSGMAMSGIAMYGGSAAAGPAALVGAPAMMLAQAKRAQWEAENQWVASLKYDPTLRAAAGAHFGAERQRAMDMNPLHLHYQGTQLGYVNPTDPTNRIRRPDNRSHFVAGAVTAGKILAVQQISTATRVLGAGASIFVWPFSRAGRDRQSGGHELQLVP